MVGQSVLHYQVLRQVGSGGMGVVYEAEDTRLGRRVALKFLPEALANDLTALERFQREARAASAMNHPNVCTVYSIEQHEGKHFLAMELLEGKPLSELMRTQRFDNEQLLSISFQIADALESAHAKGIVHRDIKPANIFLSDRGQVKVLDFGLAKIDMVRQTAVGASAATMETAAFAELTSPGVAVGTVAYMSPEQARGQLTDSRTDIFSLGAVMYQMATGLLPFPGDSSAVIFEAILNRDPAPITQINPSIPADFQRVTEKALDKDRALRYQTATDLKTDLLRIKRELESGHRKSGAPNSDAVAAAPTSVAVLYFENLSGAKEDEYFRDGMTEDIITELSKIKGLKLFPRSTVLAFRDRQLPVAQIGQQLGASYVLAGSLRRAGNRLRVNAQLVDVRTDFQLWSERYDRELKDVFEVQDEIAGKLAQALRITLSPQEQEAIAAKPTENLQAYDLYLRGKSYARRRTRQDLEFALQMLEGAVTLDPNFALAHAAMANVCAEFYENHQRESGWIDRATQSYHRAVALQPELPEALVAQAWLFYTEKRFEEATRCAKNALERRRDCEGAHYVLGRSLFVSGRYQELADIADQIVEISGDDYNVYVPIQNAIGALGKTEMLRNFRQQRILTLQRHLEKVPEDARARMHLSVSYATTDRPADALNELHMALALRPNDSILLYNAACIYCLLKKKPEALDAIGRAWRAGYKDIAWARRDPDLSLLHGDSEFERLVPPANGS
jgi:non-specific serine/threonine protein kinase